MADLERRECTHCIVHNFIMHEISFKREIKIMKMTRKVRKQQPSNIFYYSVKLLVFLDSLSDSNFL